MKPLGCSPQWASYIILTQAVSAYEKYITFAFIEFKTATLCFVKSPMVNDSVRMHTSSLPGYQGAVLFKYVKRISEILVFLKRFFFLYVLNSVPLEEEKKGDVRRRVGWGSVEGF